MRFSARLSDGVVCQRIRSKSASGIPANFKLVNKSARSIYQDAHRIPNLASDEDSVESLMGDSLSGVRSFEECIESFRVRCLIRSGEHSIPLGYVSLAVGTVVTAARAWSRMWHMPEQPAEIPSHVFAVTGAEP